MCNWAAQLTSKKIAQCDNFFLHAFTAKKKYTNYNIHNLIDLCRVWPRGRKTRLNHRAGLQQGNIPLELQMLSPVSPVRVLAPKIAVIMYNVSSPMRRTPVGCI